MRAGKRGSIYVDTASDQPAFATVTVGLHYDMNYAQRLPANGALLVAERDARRRLVMALVLFLIIVAIALGIVGAVANGLFYLLIIGIAVLVVALIYGAMLFRRGGKRPGR